MLPLLETPLGGLLHAAATGRLADHPPLQWRDGAAVTVVWPVAGYPGTPRTGDVIEGVDAAGAVGGSRSSRAGHPSRPEAAGGRVHRRGSAGRWRNRRTGRRPGPAGGARCRLRRPSTCPRIDRPAHHRSRHRPRRLWGDIVTDSPAVAVIYGSMTEHETMARVGVDAEPVRRPLRRDRHQPAPLAARAARLVRRARAARGRGRGRRGRGQRQSWPASSRRTSRFPSSVCRCGVAVSAGSTRCSR